MWYLSDDDLHYYFSFYFSLDENIIHLHKKIFYLWVKRVASEIKSNYFSENHIGLGSCTHIWQVSVTYNWSSWHPKMWTSTVHMVHRQTSKYSEIDINNNWTNRFEEHYTKFWISVGYTHAVTNCLTCLHSIARIMKVSISSESSIRKS